MTGELGGKPLRSDLRGIELADLWDAQQAEYPNDIVGVAAAAAVRLCARELRAAVATPDYSHQCPRCGLRGTYAGLKDHASRDIEVTYDLREAIAHAADVSQVDLYPDFP